MILTHCSALSTPEIILTDDALMLHCPMDIKQIIIVRKELKMPMGKVAAQVAHASMKVFLQNIVTETEDTFVLEKQKYFAEYIKGAFKKVVVYVNTEQELLSLYEEAGKNGIHRALITDSGLTCFNGVPTNTVVALGPWESQELNKITGKLPLL